VHFRLPPSVVPLIAFLFFFQIQSFVSSFQIIIWNFGSFDFFRDCRLLCAKFQFLDLSAFLKGEASFPVFNRVFALELREYDLLQRS